MGPVLLVEQLFKKFAWTRRERPFELVMSLTPLSVTGSGRWLLVGMDTGSVPTEISSPVCTGPFYPRIRSRSSRGPVLHGGRGLRHRPSDRLFVLRSVDGSDSMGRNGIFDVFSIPSNR